MKGFVLLEHIKSAHVQRENLDNKDAMMKAANGGNVPIAKMELFVRPVLFEIVLALTEIRENKCVM